jgi:hypothetical protein
MMFDTRSTTIQLRVSAISNLTIGDDIIIADYTIDTEYVNPEEQSLYLASDTGHIFHGNSIPLTKDSFNHILLP